MNILVKMMDHKEIAALGEVFKQMDIDGTGFIKQEELAEAIRKSGSSLTEEEIKQIMSEVDSRGNQKINYSEFLAATISVKTILTDEKLMAIFKQFDTDNTGFITKENLVEAMHKLGMKIKADDI